MRNNVLWRYVAVLWSTDTESIEITPTRIDRDTAETEGKAGEQEGWWRARACSTRGAGAPIWQILGFSGRWCTASPADTPCVSPPISHRKKSYSIPAVSLEKLHRPGRIINWYWIGYGEWMLEEICSQYLHNLIFFQQVSGNESAHLAVRKLVLNWDDCRIAHEPLPQKWITLIL